MAVEWIRLLAIATGAVGFVGMLGYLVSAPEEPMQSKDLKSKKKKGHTEVAEKIELDDLDPEERKLVEEIKKKGYYHGRPRSEPAPPPARIDGDLPATGTAATSSRRTEFDEFQRKWDKFGDEQFVGKL
uniref:Uncharacterized protein n=1 Tax=Pyrodinium bahamense TaxID=73915 RepID=A0A7S0AS66_9DINO|mmetsp:Transcript_40361/g.112075  ORF Transcript_40361/g.112075 Transcript_40361/m.112075 type:complete len:129 (+) Transcript_40361:105-491(+)